MQNSIGNQDLHSQPKSLYFLSFAEGAERLSFWGIQSLLLLYLTKALHLFSGNAYLIYGSFTALTFSLSIVGGILADKLFGFRRMLILGIVFSMIGNMLLMLPFLDATYLGLVFLICGSGLAVSNNANLLGTYYQDNDNRRVRGFTVFYMATNIGAVLGPVIYGFLQNYGWHVPFLMGSLSLALWIIFYSIYKDVFSNYGSPPNKEFSQTLEFEFLFYCLSLIILFVCLLLIQHPHWVGKVLVIAGISTLLWITIANISQTNLQRLRMMVLILMIGCALFFFACAFQIYSSLLLFIDKQIDRHLFNLLIPTSAFAALEPFFIVILSPIGIKVWQYLNSKNKEPEGILKISIGLFLASASFLVFAFSAYQVGMSEKEGSLLWILIGNFLLAAGEICIMPPLISAITIQAPKNMRGTFMGLLYLSLAFSGYIAGLIARLTGQVSNQLVNMQENVLSYYAVYLRITLLALGLAIFMLILSLPIKKCFPNLFIHGVANKKHL